MNPNLKKDIQDIKEKQKNLESAVDCVDLERCLREFKTELYIKRDEVNQLRTELDAANLEAQNLRRTLDVTKKSFDENQFNLNLQLKKARHMEEELHEKRNSLMKMQLQSKMATAEVDALKENLQKAEMEKIELSRKVDVFEAKQRHNSTYHNEILKRDNHLRNFIASINEIVQKLQTEQLQVQELSKNNLLADEAMEKLKICVDDNEKLRKQKERFEEMYIKVNAKYEKLEELMSKDSTLNKPNLLTKIVLNQWKSNRLHYEVQIKDRNEILDKMTESYTKEKATNIKLIRENENVRELNKELQEENTKLKDLSKENSENIKTLKETIKSLEERILKKDNKKLAQSEISNEIKDEPIEIED